MNIFFISYFKKIKKKFNALKMIYHLKSPEIIGILQDELRLKGILIHELSKVFNISNEKDEDLLHETAEKISGKIINNNTCIEKTHLDEIFQDMFAHVRWTYSIVSGFSCLWELQLKIFADNLGIDVYIDQESKNRKQRNTGVLVYRELSLIIKDLEEKTQKQFSAIKRNAELRNCLVHGNFDQLRSYLILPKKKISDPYKGNVFAIDINTTGDVTNLSNHINNKDKSGIGPFGWFLEGTNSSLLQQVWECFSESMDHIQRLSFFRSISFDGREKVFNSVMYEKGCVQRCDIDLYQEYFKVNSSFKNINANEYFVKLEECFNRKINA